MRHRGAFVAMLFVPAPAAPACAQGQAAEPPAPQRRSPASSRFVVRQFMPGSSMRSYDFAQGGHHRIGGGIGIQGVEPGPRGPRKRRERKASRCRPAGPGGYPGVPLRSVSLGCYAKYSYFFSPVSDVMNGFGGMHVPVKSGTSIGIDACMRFSDKADSFHHVSGPPGSPSK
jgi:hypothetical protein